MRFKFDHIVSWFNVVPLFAVMSHVAVCSAHMAIGYHEGRFCEWCWNLKPFDAPLV